MDLVEAVRDQLETHTEATLDAPLSFEAACDRVIDESLETFWPESGPGADSTLWTLPVLPNRWEVQRVPGDPTAALLGGAYSEDVEWQVEEVDSAVLDDDVTSSNVLFSTSSDEIAVEHTCGEIGHVAPFPPGGLTLDATAGGDPYAAREQLHAALRESMPALDALEENAASADARQLDQRLLVCPPGVRARVRHQLGRDSAEKRQADPAALSAAKAADELADVSAGPSLWAAIEADAISPKAYDAAAAPGARSSRRHDDDDDGAADARACDPPAAAVDGSSATAAMTPPDLDAGTDELERWLDTLTLEPIAACDVGEDEAAPPRRSRRRSTSPTLRASCPTRCASSRSSSTPSRSRRLRASRITSACLCRRTHPRARPSSPSTRSRWPRRT